MKLFFETFSFLLIAASLLFSQSEHDTIKILNNKKITTDNKNQLIIKSNSLEKNQHDKLEVGRNIYTVPLSIKIYQQIFADEKFEFYNFQQEDLNSGLSSNELIIFEQNKSQTKKMLSDIYGEDIIDLKTILKNLGITKEQIVIAAAILKFLFYNPVF